jgi:DNA polymerase-4
VERGLEEAFLSPLSIRKIPMIGKKTSDFFYEMGITKVKTLREMPVQMLEATFGKNGRVIWNKAHGIDNTPVIPYSERKSISTESTFDSDSIDVKRMRSILTAMVEKLAFQLRSEQKLCACIAVKIRYSDFETTSRQINISYTSSDKVLIKNTLDLFGKLYNRRVLVRLIGVRLSKLVHGNYQINLFEDTQEEICLFEAMDKMKRKYGAGTLMRASTLDAGSKHRYVFNSFTG